MKVKFLGTSAGWPLPRLGCNCQICTSKDSKDKRLRPAILVNDSVLVDAGPDIYHQLQPLLKTKSCQLKTILVTHAHPDHILGFHDLSHIYNKEGAITVFAPQEVINGIKKIFDFPASGIKFIPTQPEQQFEVANLKITYFPVEHTRKPAFGIKIKGEKLISYIPDLRKLPKLSATICRSCDILILDGSSLGPRGQTISHQSIEEGIELAKKLKPKKVYFTHLGHSTGRHENLEDFVQEAPGGSKFHIAYDGLELEL